MSVDCCQLSACQGQTRANCASYLHSAFMSRSTVTLCVKIKGGLDECIMNLDYDTLPCLWLTVRISSEAW